MSEKTKTARVPSARVIRPTVVASGRFASHHFTLRVGENMCGERTIWLDLNGSSYVPAATDRRSATAMAKQLRLAADWLDMRKRNTFRKRSV